MENKKLFELSGTVETIIFRNEENGYTVIELSGDEEYVAVGIMPDISPGEEVKLIGTFKHHPSYGQQFSVTTYEKSIPSDIAGILKYLSSGAIKGVGPATASNLVKHFGSATLEVLENEPERVAGIRGISLDKANSISQQLQQNIGIRELMLYLANYDISPVSAVKIYKSFGNHSIEEIKNNPFSLVGNNFGIGFETADKIAKMQGRPDDEIVRIRAGIIYVLSHNRGNGHTCLPTESLISTTSGFLLSLIHI